VAFTVGDLIDGHYRVERRFAGGMGFVYIVLDEVVGKRFAIKQLPSLQAENKILQERFRREAAAWLLLEHHPNIVQAHSFHPRPEGPMLILECIEGPSLDQLLKQERKLSPAQVVRYARQFCQAMTYAHLKPIAERGVGVLHRDIKPGNILITRGNVLKVTDFGLAKLEGDSRITSEGQFVGTIAYSSPEQLRSASQVTKASDVYSFGAVMYQMLSGRAPFLGRSAAELFQMILSTPPLPLDELMRDLDHGLAGVVMRCLEKEAVARFRDFPQLEKALAGMEITLRDRRDWTCGTCGFISRSPATTCPVCDSAVDPGTPLVPTVSGWSCACGVRVSHAEKICPKCGHSRATRAAAVDDDDAPPPLPGDLVKLASGSDPGVAPPDHKPGDTLWPVRPAAAPSPGDSHIGNAISAARTDAPATKRLWDPTSAQPCLIELGSREKLMAWYLERASYTIGRDAQMRIRLRDPAAAPNQLFLVRLACGWLAMNRQPGTRVEVNGWKTDQRLLRPGDVLHFGSTWLLYSGPPPSTESAPPIPGRWRDVVGVNTQTVQSGGSAATQVPNTRPAVCVCEFPNGHTVRTQGEPLRLGSTRLCNVQLDDASVAPVHALIAWRPDGPHLFALNGSSIPTDEGDASDDHVLWNGFNFELGAVEVHVRMEGDPTAPARARAAAESSTPRRHALTIAAGPQKGQSAILPNGQPVVLGRHSDCELAIATDPYMSRRHLQFISRGDQLEVADLGSRHGFAVGPTTMTTTAIARLGDVIRVGQHYLLLHIELGAE